MFVALPTPILSVAADAVRDLDGGEALPGLWTLFTKCKESLRDGRRLENMCWRLWYREMKISSGDRYEYTLDSNSEKWYIEADDRAYRPPTPEEVAQQVLASQSNGLASVQAPRMTDRLTCVTPPRPTATRRLSSVSLIKKAKPISTGVGKIICDLLPQSLPPQEELRRAVPSWRTTSTASAMPPPETCPLKCDQPPSDLDAKRSSLPTPSTDNNELRAYPQSNENFPEGPTSPDPVDSTPMQLFEAQDPSGSEVPALSIVDTSSPPAPLITASNLIRASPESSLRDPDPSLNTALVAPPGLTQPPPRLIIVNPTPNPTPHPTPPATPVLSSASSQFIITTGVHVTVPSGNQHLIPPPLFHMAPVLPVVTGGLESEQSLIVQGDTSTADVAHALITSVAETGAPRMQREELQVPPSPALTEEALVPPQPETKTMNPIDREQLHHPLTIQTKIGTVTSKRSNFLMLVPSSPSVVAHIFGEPTSVQDVTDSPTKSIFSSPTKDTASIDSPSKKSGKGSPRPREPARRQSCGAGKPTSSMKKMSRANSTGNVVIAPTTSSGTQSRSGSRSRSRESHGPGLGLGGGALAMTRTTSAGGSTRSRSKVAVVSRMGAWLGARKAADKERERSKSKDRIEEKEDDEDTLKRPTFNIGSNSDEGSGIGSKSVGSGSEVSGAVAPVAIAVMLSEVKEEEVRVIEEETNIKMVATETQVIAEDEEALLPQQQRRIVLATSESDEYETESDEWSSEDMSADDAEVVKSGGNNAQRSKAQIQPQQPQPQPQPPPPPIQQHRAGAHAHVDEANRHKHLPTHHHPPHHPHAHHPHAHHIEKLSQLVRNAKRQSVNHGKAHAQSIEQAALEAQRQREMFAKIPPSQNLARTTSVGLLSQLMNPDPQIFPPNHPYRRGLSTGEIRSGQGHIRLHAGMTMTGAVGPAQANLTPFQAQRPTQPHQPAQRNSQKQGQGTLAPPVTAAPTEVRRHVSAPQQHAGAPGTLAPGLKPSKSSAAGPVASQVLVGSVRSNTRVGENGVLNSSPGVSKQSYHSHVRDDVRPGGGYRPRARPQDAELEEESESEDERAIQLSKSVAQEKLRALAERRGIRPNRRASTDDEPAWAQRHEQQQQHQYQPQQRHHSHLQPPPGPVRMHTSPAPIPQVLAHPYNLPLTALPTTPRTTRLHMMQTEMSESLRRNLLWERRVSKNNILGFRRTASSGGGVQGNVINGLRPLTTNEPPNVVHLSAKGTNVNGNAGGAVPPMAAGGAGQESSTRAFSRNRSWAANDYHYAGW